MKIAILGGYGPTQSVGAVFRAFRRAGHHVEHWPTLPQFDPTAPRDAVDLLFTFKIGHGNIPPGWIAAQPATTKVFWSFDDPHWICGECDPWIAREHDVVLSSCWESLEVYRKRGCGNAYFMPPAMDLEYYRDWRSAPAAGRHPEQPIAFFATNLYPRHLYPHTFVDRGEMVDRLTALFGSDFALFGYSDDVTQKPAYRAVLQWEGTLPRVIEGTQININTHVRNTHRLYFNERFFQIAATRRAMFVDRMPGYLDLFSEEDFVMYASLDELIDRIRYFRARPEQLAALGQRGFDRVRAWTYDAFTRQVIRASEGEAAVCTLLG